MEDALTGAGQLGQSRSGDRSLEGWVRDQFGEHGPGLRRYLMRMLGDATLAEDLAQEVFLRLFEEAQKRNRVEKVRPWVFQVGHNIAIDHLRRSGKDAWPAQSELMGEPDQSPNAEELLLKAERMAQVRQALCLLSPQERQVIELRAEGLKYREIADLMGLQLSSVATFLGRAVNKIARQIHA
ncbi:MAG: sigma-70 family RNA polymerase sigma factor [Acidobacteria bacterium]|nr:sigma-70 family RNA polymerase sigma factor [Acidobacteriota bacterium]